MKSYCITGNLKPECVKEYKEKHKTLHLGEHKELLKVIKDSGIQNEKVFIHKNMIIIYFEAEDLDKSYQIQGKSDIVKQWNDIMKPMFADTYNFNEKDHTLPILEKVFDLNEQLGNILK